MVAAGGPTDLRSPLKPKPRRKLHTSNRFSAPRDTVSISHARYTFKALQDRAASRAADIAPVISELQRAGKTNLRAIAAGSNQAGIPTPREQCDWSAKQVQRVSVLIIPLFAVRPQLSQRDFRD